MFKLPFPALALVVAIFPLGGCAITPLHLVGPAAMAIMKLDQSPKAPGPVSISSMLNLARGGDKVDTNGKLAPASTKNAEAIERLLANARGSDSASGTPKPATSAVSLAELRSQVREAASPSDGATCK